MPNPDARNIFGLAISVAYARSLPYSANISNKVCQAIAQGFGLSSTDGNTAYVYFSTQSNPESTAGIFSQPYLSYESDINDILTVYLPSAEITQIKILTVVSHAMIFAYATNSAINIVDFQKILGNVLKEVSSQVLEVSLFRTHDDITITPFSSYSVLKPLLEKDYSSVISSFTSEAKTIEVPLANYNWYDAAKIFHGPDLQIMKDIENQYYYLSGQIIYDSPFGNIEPCVEDAATISTWSGDATFTYYRQTPCRKIGSYIGPPESVEFNRIFNDGPSSIGYFTSGLSGLYIGNDKAMLDKTSYLTNTYSLYSYTGSPLASNVAIDANGEYDLLHGDYLNAPYAFDCIGTYQRLHIGDNRPRYVYDKNTCTPTLRNTTGFKFVSLALPDNNVTMDWQFRQTNPVSTQKRILSRSLNLDNNPYWATDVGGILYPYTQLAVPPFTQFWTVGYPVLQGGNTLPELAFYQTFESPTFGEGASLVIFPSTATSAGAVGEGVDSSRSYSVASLPIFSGGGSLPIRFNQKISSNLSGLDTITQQFLGMGTAFSGKYDVIVVAEENAGFQYSGFSVLQNGVYVNSTTLADSFLESTVGNKYKIIKYISGYRRLSDGAIFGLTNKYAKDGSGNLLTYAYISQEDVPQGVIQQDGWAYFVPAPALLEDQSIYERVYGEQTPENYLPRFYDGPFSKETRTFLYPNAKEADKIYQGKINGIPSKVRFKVNIREEVVKEVYGKYTIYPDGTITSNPEIVHTIRADTLGGRAKNPKMTNLFVVDSSSDSYDYDFNFWGEDKVISSTAYLPDLVDINWAPLFITGGLEFIISGRNNDIYGSSTDAYNLFSYGLKRRTNTIQNHLYVGPSKNTGLFYSPKRINDGLFRAFEFTPLSGELDYVLPIFDLTTNSVHINDGMLSAFPDVIAHQGLPYFSYDGYSSVITTGTDPLFLETIGGRRGGPTAEAEGGYHSKEIIGDKWMGMVYSTFGTRSSRCFLFDGQHVDTIYRYPGNDKRLMLFNADASGTDLWVNGMSFAPYIVNRNTQPLTTTMSYPYINGQDIGNLTVSKSGEFITFNLGSFFPVKTRTGDAMSTQWYSQSGFRLGPFDRDVEIGISQGERIVAYSEFYINNKKLSHWFDLADNCDRDWIQDIAMGQFLQPGEPFYSYPRRMGYSILSVIPSGTQGVFNIFSDVTNATPGDPAANLIGMPTGAILTLRTHVPVDADVFDPYLYSGEEGRLRSAGYVNNGIPKKYRLENTSLEALEGTWSFINYGYSGKLYEKPDETEFKKTATYDRYGNLSYPSGFNVQTYWRSQAIKNGSNVYFSGYREGSRISFEIYDVEIDYDKPPYQTYDIVTPSGDCFLSGEMGYYAQADNSIFTEGVYLTNTTVNDDFNSTYNPSYVSDVLKRLPSGMFVFPITLSGFGDSPVLQAPSVMKQREYVSGISEGQSYSYLFKEADNNYNKLLWPALSDLETLNPGETIESVPPGDGETFTNSTMMFSASQGQDLPNGLANPIVMKRYSVQSIFQLYDSTATDAIINSGYCITSGRGQSVQLSQDSNLSGALVPRGTPLSFVLRGVF